MLIDTHAHLEAVEDLDGVLERAKNVGVGKIVTIGTSVETSKKAVKIAEEFSTDDLKIFATCGIHPKDGKSEVEKLGLTQCIDTFKKVVKSSDKVVGIGECGLDYYPATAEPEKSLQRTLFESQIQLAIDLKLPLVIHCRDAWDEIFGLLTTDYGLQTKSTGVFHSWTGDWQTAKSALDLGFYISFSGIVTFKNAKEIQEVAQKMPLDRILIETDSPFLSPEPWRGKINEPKNVKIIAEFIAILRSLSLDQIAQVTSENTERLFGFENL